MSHKKTLLCLIFILLSLTSFANIIPVAYLETAEISSEVEKNGSISFSPNNIPEVDVYYQEYSFVFEYKAFFIRVKPFVKYNGTWYGLKTIIPWLKSQHPSISYKWLVKKAISSIHYGFNLTALPPLIANYTEAIAFKLVDLNFPLSWLQLEEIEVFDPDVDEPYNITRIHIPKANLVFGFEDLYPYGYSVEHINSTYILVGNIKGRTDLILDPITFSTPTITVIGGTEGSELDSMDIWNADQAGGWNVVHNNNDTNTQFEFNAKIVFGNGTVAGTTWFADEEVQWVFNDGVFSAHYERWMDLKNYAYIRFGVLENATEKTTSSGCQFIALESHVQYLVYNLGGSSTFCYFYSCSIDAKNQYGHIYCYYNLRIYNCIIQNFRITPKPTTDVFNSQTTKGDFAIALPTGTWNRITITEMSSAALYIRYSATIRNLYARQNNDLWRAVNHKYGDLYLIDCDSDVWTGVWSADSTSELVRQYTFDIRAVFENQTGIADANVTLTDTDGTELFNIQTDSNGEIATQTVTYCFYNQTGGDTPYLQSPHTLKIFKEGIRMYKSVFSITKEADFILTLTPRGWHTGTEGITFQPNSMPKVKTFYSDYTFYFTYEEYRLGLRPFAIYNNETWKMKDIVPFLKSQGVTYTWAFKKMKEMIHYGFNVTGIPEKIAANLNYLGFKVVDHNFPLKAIQRQIIQREAYNVTILSIPKINLDFSFEDLQERGYSVTFINKTYLLIGNVNQTDLDIDPITYSSPIITIVGFTEGSPCDFQDVCDVNDANAWDVVDAVGEDQFFFEAKIVLGDGSTQTWFADIEKTVIFSDGLSGNMFKIEDNATLRFGELIVSAERRTRRGITMITLKAASHYPIYMHAGVSFDPPRLLLYSSTIRAADTDARISLSGEVEIYETTIDQAILLIETDRTQDSYDFYRLNVKGADYGIWSYSSSALMEDLLVHSNSYGIRFDGSASGNINNTVFRNNTKLLLAYYLTANCYLTDVSADDWDLTFIASSGEIYRRYSFDLTIIFQNGTYAQNANVTITNSYLGTSDSWLTNSIGQIPSQIYSYGHYNDTADDILYNYNPYNISISFEGFQTNTLLYNHTKTTDLTLALVATAPEEAAPLRTVFLMFLIALVFSIIYETKRYKAWSGIIASGCWIILGLSWFILAASQVIVIGLLWNGIGIFYIVRWMIDLIGMRSIRKGRRLGDDDSDSL